MGETDCILDLEAHRTLRPPGKEERTLAEKVTCIVRGETHRYSDCSRILLLLPMHCPPAIPLEAFDINPYSRRREF